MYVPKAFQVHDTDQIFDYIRANGFACLLGCSDDGMRACHLPMSVEKKNGTHRLLGHISAGNDLRHTLASGEEMLAIFMNTHTYVSSSWYGHVNVPTWNYIAVHIYGRPRILNKKELLDAMYLLVEQYEEGRKNRYRIDDMSSQSLDRHLKGVVGFELSIDRVEASYKLSQNRNNEDFQSIVEQLLDSNKDTDRAVAEEMKGRRPTLFS